MSACLFLVPLAVGLVTSAVEGTAAVVYACEHSKRGKSAPIQTKFCDAAILEETLKEHGVPYKIKNDGEITADFTAGKIRYFRESADQPFEMQVFGVKDMDQVACNVQAIEAEYGSNVQQYTYNHIKASLPENMSVASEEILEDDSILLTLEVND
ncbi:MAG: hypothetical protein ACI39G_02655 [Pseudoramibacter sp.]